MSKRCDFCGHFNTDEAKVCKNCGTDIDLKEEKVKDIGFIDNNLLLLSIIFIYVILTLLFIILGSYNYFQSKYIIISFIFIILGFILISRGIFKHPYLRRFRILLITSTIFTIFIIPLVYFLTSIEIVS